MKIMKVKQPDGNIVSIPIGVGVGRSPYEYAKEAGYNGTEEEFAEALIEIPNLTPRLSALETQIFENDNEILGLEIDFENNTFTRLAGARGLEPGKDFDKYNMFGGRKRCTVENTGRARINNWYSNGTEEKVLFDSDVELTGTTTTETIIGNYTSLNTEIAGKETKIVVTVGEQDYEFNVAMANPSSAPMACSSITFSDGVTTLLHIFPQGVTSNASSTPLFYNGGFQFVRRGSVDSTTIETIHVKIICKEYPLFANDGSEGQVMVYQPKFYYMVVPTKLEKQSVGEGYNIKKVKYYVSDKPKEGFKLHPVFYNAKGKEIDYVLYSAYESGYSTTSNGSEGYFDDNIDTDTAYWDYLTSVANVRPVSGQVKQFSRKNFQEAAHTRHTNWSIETLKSICANQLLMIIEAGTMNLQKAFGYGIVDGENDWSKNLSELTGQTTKLGNQSTQFDYTFNAVSYRGIENPWGNIFKHIQGINIKYGNDGYNNLYIANDFNFDNTKIDDNYEDVGFVMSQTFGGYISAFGYNKEKFDWLLIPTEFNGTSELPVGDFVTTLPSLGDTYYIAPMTTDISVAGEDGVYTSVFAYDSEVAERNRIDSVNFDTTNGSSIRYIKYSITKIYRATTISEIEVYEENSESKIELTTENLDFKRIFDTDEDWGVQETTFYNSEYLVDGDYSTYSYWDQQRSEITEFPTIPRCEITIDLGSAKNLSQIKIRAGSPYPSALAGAVVGGCWASGNPGAGSFCGEWSIKNDWASYLGARLFYVPEVDD